MVFFLGSWSNKFAPMPTSKMGLLLGPPPLHTHWKAPNNEPIKPWNINHSAFNVKFSSIYNFLILSPSTLCKVNLHYEKIGDFTIRLTINFLNCSIHLQLMVFLWCECYWTNCNRCIKHPKLYIVSYVNKCMCNSNATNYSH